MESAGEQPNAPPRWIIEHDDRWLWTGLYIGSAIVLSIFISLFWLLLVVAVHGVLEWIRQRHEDARLPGVIARVSWELKLDVALVLFAIVVALYMDLLLGAAGLGGAARAGAQAAARGGAWAKAIRGFLLSIDDAAQLARAALTRGGEGEPDHLEGPALWGGWTRRWGIGGWIAVTLSGFSLLLILLTPVLTGHDLSSMIEVLSQDLHPWPSNAVGGE